MNTDIAKKLSLIQAGKIPTGYKKTILGIIPEDWDVVRFRDRFTRVTRKNTEGNSNVLTISAQYGLINQNEFFNKTVASDDKSNYFLLSKGEFAYNKSYSNGYPFGALKRLEYYDKGVVSPLYICFAANELNKQPDYYVQYFEAGLMNREIQAFAQEGARNHGLLNISVDDFFNSNLICPPIEEQRKIADILAAQDRVIKQKSDAIAQKITYKALLAQQLATGKKRLKGFSGKWAKKKLSDFACLLTESLNPFDYPERIYSVYSLPAFDNDRTPELLPGSEISTNKFKVCSGLILFNKLNVRQKRVWLIEDDNPNTMIASTEFLPLSVHDINKGFLLNLLLSDSVTNYLKKKSSGTSNSQKRILPKDLLSLSINVPSLPEQEAIAKVLSIMDKEISLLQRSLEQEKLKKKSLMQLLLTGIVRVSA